MDRTLPAWGLFRLFKALGDKKVTGLLSMQFEGGRARFFLKQGFVTDCQTDIPTLSFGMYLLQSGMVSDPERARTLGNVRRLVDEGIVRAEDAVRLHTNFVRSVLDVLLPEAVMSWSFAPSLASEAASTEEAVDICAELFTVVQQHPDLSMMRTIVMRYGPAVRVTQTVSPGCVLHAKAHFRSSLLVTQLLAGTCTVINDEILDDDRSLRILFAFAVAGALSSCSPDEAAPHADIPTGPSRQSVAAPVAQAAAAPAVSDHAVSAGRREQSVQSQAGTRRDVPASGGAPEYAWPEFMEVMRGQSAKGPAPAPQTQVPGQAPGMAAQISRGLDFLTADEPDEEQSMPAGSSLAVDGDVPEVGDSAFDGFGDAPRKAPRKVRKTAGGRPNPIDPVLEDALNSEVRRAEGLNHYELLEINADARLSAVRMAVLRAKRRFSVSRYEGSVSADALVRLHALLDRVDEAFEVLCNLDERVSYNRSLGMSSPALESVLVAMFDARTMWRQGMDLLEQHKVNEAIEKFENAESYDAEEPLYLCSQGMALLALPPAEDTNESIESLIDVAFSFDQDLVEAHILAANYMVRRNDYEAARTHIRKVLTLDPDNREAKSFKQRSRVSQVGAQVSFKKKSESILDRALKLIKR